MRQLLDEAAILRVLASLLSAELARSGRATPLAVASNDEHLRLDATGLALDSLERIACATAINVLFQLHETGIEDALLVATTMGGWARVVGSALSAGTSGITVRSSGSTGAPRSNPHSWDRLTAEIGWLTSLLRHRPRRVVQLVPAHHLYGFTFAALLPTRLGVPVLDARATSLGEVARLLAPGDLVVGVPPQLRALAQLRTPELADVVAVSSGAALPPDVAAALHAAGAAVLDVYGSSETGGVAVRRYPDRWHRLLPMWRAGQGGEDASVVDAQGVSVPLPDRVVWEGPDLLRLVGRKDFAVQVGGVNVFPTRVAAVLADHPLVADCAVRLDDRLPEPRLKALVVPDPSARHDSRLIATLEKFCRERLSSAERPVRIDLAAALPRTAMGKPCDWVSSYSD